MTKVDLLVHFDWLRNMVSVGSWVVYSSKSTNSGMNLGRVEYLGPSKAHPNHRFIVQVRVYKQSNAGWSKGRLVTLSEGESAFNSITRYFGTIPQDVE